MPRRVLTGIKPTGTPHLGNYAGAIKPAIEQSKNPNVESYFFLADYHALIGGTDPTKVQRSTLEIAASWIALGLNVDKVAFYRQSDIPEIAELNWLLSIVASKGLLNRAHAYKAAVDHNHQQQLDADHGITAGLYGYPVLMAADILMFNAHSVPVGKDQVQHIEITRDIATRFNHVYHGDYFVLPDASVDESTAVLPGLDGRKMSKSYDNVIGIFLDSKALRERVMQIQTNSKEPGERKETNESSLYDLYQAFASAEQSRAYERALHAGLGWGDAKQQLFELLDATIAPAREEFQRLMQNPNQVEQILLAGAKKIRPQAQAFMATLRSAVGLRSLSTLSESKSAAPIKKQQARLLTFKDSEGFRFKLQAADGKTTLSESIAFEDARSCGQIMSKIKSGDAKLRATDFGHEWMLDDAVIANGACELANVEIAVATFSE